VTNRRHDAVSRTLTASLYAVLAVAAVATAACKGNFKPRDAGGDDADHHDPADADPDLDVAIPDADRDSTDDDIDEDCMPSCGSRQCGTDGCGGLCAPGCGPSQACSAFGQCEEVRPWTWASVPGGSFAMGSLINEAGRYDNEVRHTVTLTHGFVILSTEVTQADFTALMGYNPSTYTDCGPDCPVETLNWHQAAAYCNALSDGEGFRRCYDCDGLGRDIICTMNPAFDSPYDCPGYRLPTEAEWELSARASTTTATYNGDLPEDAIGCESPNMVLDSIAWFCGDSDGSLHAVARLEPNELGLYDMLGNVYEWVNDLLYDYPTTPVTDPWGSSDGLLRVIRGGSWNYGASEARAANRGWTNGGAIERLDFVGFRVARTSGP